jgi:hypothetical protein
MVLAKMQNDKNIDLTRQVKQNKTVEVGMMM